MLPLPPAHPRHASSLAVPTTGFVPSPRPGSSHAVLALPQEKPENDTNEYRLLRLHNGLQALLIRDPETDRAGAAIDVGVGHLDDPPDVPGCAHFCEHLSFMGTKQFPKENEYQEFIQTHGGGTNAYTAASNTNYYFHISAGQLMPALERFSTFFHSPLFSENATMKEIQAVDSEHKKNLNSDGWRLFQLSKALSAPGHVWTKFGSGNARTLGADVNQGRDAREKLIRWWEREYAAERMALCVYGRESLDEMESSVVRLFDPVPNRGLRGLPLHDEPALGADQLGTVVFAKSIMDFRSLEVTWPIPWQSPHYLVKPVNFLSHFLGHEGPGSLYAYLKSRGWALALSAGKYSGGRGFDFFKVTVSLTKEGMENYEDVATAVYKYIALLKASPLPAWTQDELIQLSRTAFRFIEKQAAERIVSGLASEILRPFPRDAILSTSSLVKEWDEAEVRALLACLTVRASNIMLVAQDMDAGKLNAKEAHYGTEYGVERMSEQFIARAEQPNDIPALHLPLPNAFIPSDLSVDRAAPAAQPAKRPTLIHDAPALAVWHKKDDQFLVPKAAVYMEFRSPLASVTPRQAVKTRMHGELVRDALNEYAYDASLAGLHFNAGGQSDAFALSVEGYNDKLPVLLATVLEKVKRSAMQRERFDVLKAELTQDYTNFSMEQPYEQADWWLGHLLRDRVWPAEVKIAELDTLTLDEVELHAREILSRMHVELLITGNISEEAALKMVRNTEEILQAKPLTAAEKMKERSYLLPHPANYVFQKEVPHADDPNNSLAFYVQLKSELTDKRQRALLGLFAHIIHEPCFTELRTKEQLGYIVFSSSWILQGTMGLHIAVQSERDPVYLESRVEAFLDYVRQMLADMTPDEFEKLKQGLIDKRLQKVKNLTEEAHRFWAHIHNGYMEFSRRETDAEWTRGFTKQDMIDFFNAHIHQSSPTRAKLSIHMRSQVRPGTAAKPKFTMDAARALLPTLTQHAVPIEEDQYFALAAPEPPLAVVSEFMQGFLASLPHLKEGEADEIMASLEKAAQAHPAKQAPVDGEMKLPEGVEVVTDVPTFQAGLLKSKAAVPVPQDEDSKPVEQPPQNGNGNGTSKL